jgi:hypothetical protein
MNQESSEEQTPNYETVTNLFLAARQQDEFEFICAILRMRGAESAGWDTLEESWQLADQLSSLLLSPLEDDLKIRLLLLLYCHVTEMDDLYHLLGNLLRVTVGDRYSIAPFATGAFGHKRPAITPSAKIGRLGEWAEGAGFPEIGRLLNFILVRQVRNAFFHSDYILYESMFRIKRGQGLALDGYVTREIPLVWLVPRMETAVNLLFFVVDLLQQHTTSYQQPKRIKGRFTTDGSYGDLELIVKEGYGLVGFRSV